MDIEQRTVGGNLSHKYTIEMRIVRLHKVRGDEQERTIGYSTMNENSFIICEASYTSPYDWYDAFNFAIVYYSLVRRCALDTVCQHTICSV